MPITVDTEPNQINVILGYGDIGIGIIDDDNYKGVGLVQLRDHFKSGEEIPEDQQQGRDTIRVCILLRNQRGLAELRRALSSIEQMMGVSTETLADRIANGLMGETGDLEAEIDRLKYKLAHALETVEKLKSM